MRLRQVAWVAEKLEPVLDELRRALDLGEPFRDPGVGTFGLHNAVLPVGDTFLEIVSPQKEGTSAGRWLARRGGDAGYMVIFQSDDLASDRARLAGIPVRIVWEAELEDAATVHLHPRDVGAAIVSLDAMEPPESWRWGGPDWQARARTGTVRSLAGVDLVSPEPEVLGRRWAEVLGLPLLRDGEVFRIALDRGELRFAEGGEEKVAAVRLEASDRSRAGDEIPFCGTRLLLV